MRLANADDAASDELRAMVSRFASLVVDWHLSDMRVDELLAVEAGRARRLLEGRSLPGRDAETRMRRALDLDALLAAALGSADVCRAWLVRPNPAILGHRTPLDVICDRSDGMRAMRDALREEALQSPVSR